jgi:small-conductance mechanosensitive channel
VTTARQAAKVNTMVSPDVGHLITISGTIAFLVFALLSTFAFAHWARAVLERFIGAAYGAIVRYVMILIGICVVLLGSLSMLGFRIAQLVVSGAVAGVLITIAAQQSLSNLFAGVMLQFARPFKVGDRVQIRSGALAGTIEGLVSEFSITYVQLETLEGPVLVPNSQVLAAAVSPVRQPGQEEPVGPPAGQPRLAKRAEGPGRRGGRKTVAGAPAGHRPRLLPANGRSVIRLVLLNDLRRNPAAIADFHA